MKLGEPIPKLSGRIVFGFGVKIDGSLLFHAVLSAVMVYLADSILGFWFEQHALIALIFTIAIDFTSNATQGLQYYWNENNIFDYLEFALSVGSAYGVYHFIL